MDIARARLCNQRLTSRGLKTPAEVVGWFGAIQAQDYHGAKWAVAQRMQGAATDGALEQAFAEGTVLRTHVMRPTWHFVAPRDIRWMLELTAPRVRLATRARCLELELDERTFARANRALERALERRRHLTRDGVRQVLARAQVSTEGQRLAYILMRTELDGVICSGPRVGKQFTYALLDDRAPRATRLSRDEALAELTSRYFRSHGPARLRDFTWWSGLTAADAKAGVRMARPRLQERVVDGTSYWLAASMPARDRRGRTAFLLPAFDEYLVAYTGRGAALDPAIVVDGQVVGTWKRTVGTASVTVMLRFFAAAGSAERRAAVEAAARYGTFAGAPVSVSIDGVALRPSRAAGS